MFCRFKKMYYICKQKGENIMIKIDELISDAMRQKDRELLNVLKLIKAEFLKKQTEPNRPSKELTEHEQFKVLTKMISQRKDSIQQYVKGGRPDLADNEKKELDIISNFMPKQPTEEELSAFIRDVASKYVKDKQSDNSDYKLSMRDMKPIMEIVKEKYAMADGKVVSQIIKEMV